MRILLLLAFQFFLTNIAAQSEKIPYLGDKPGTFEILSRTDYSMY